MLKMIKNKLISFVNHYLFFEKKFRLFLLSIIKTIYENKLIINY